MRFFLAGLLTAAVSFSVRADEAARTKDVDLVVCLDVSGSMTGLIDSAKARLWDVVNELAKMKPTPNLRVSIYSYGAASYPAASGYVRKEIDLTTDLDEVYAKLNALRIGGSEEYVARVTKTALTDQKWSPAKDALKIIFVCGNEPANQDLQVPLVTAAALAKELGVVVNAIYCGPKGSEADVWADFAKQCGGQFATIDQGRVKKQPHIATPYDKEIVTWDEKLNGTYVAIGGEAGKKGLENQVAQDKNADANGARGDRAGAKAGTAYRNSKWDLVDKLKEDPTFDLAKLKDEEMPDCLKKLTPEERKEYVQKKAAERAEIQKAVADLSAKRQKHIDAELKKLPPDAGDVALDAALKGIIRDQATAKGFAVAEKK